MRLALTLGDPRGIGPEIAAKALSDPRIAALGASWYVIGPTGTAVPVHESVGVWAPTGDRRVDTAHAGQLAGLAVERAARMALAGEASPEAWVSPLRNGGIAAYDGFRREPDAAEAEAFGCFPHADGQSHDTWRDCAPRITRLQQLRLGLGLGDSSYGGHWPEASLRRSGGALADRLIDLKRMRRVVPSQSRAIASRVLRRIGR